MKATNLFKPEFPAYRRRSIGNRLDGCVWDSESIQYSQAMLKKRAVNPVTARSGDDARPLEVSARGGDAEDPGARGLAVQAGQKVLKPVCVFFQGTLHIVVDRL